MSFIVSEGGERLKLTLHGCVCGAGCEHVYMRARACTLTLQGMINILGLLGHQSFQFALGYRALG